MLKSNTPYNPLVEKYIRKHKIIYHCWWGQVVWWERKQAYRRVQYSIFHVLLVRLANMVTHESKPLVRMGGRCKGMCVVCTQNGKDSNKWHQNWKRRCYKWYWNGGEPYGLHLHLVFHLSSVCRKTSAGEELRAVRKCRNKGNQSNRLNNRGLVIKHNQSRTFSSFSRFID